MNVTPYKSFGITVIESILQEEKSIPLREELVKFVPVNSTLLKLIFLNLQLVKEEILNNVDMRKWICVSAEKLYVTNHNNIIFFVMSDEDWATATYNSFKKYVGNEIGKELQKSGEEDIELPEERPAQ